ncbi:anti-sigma factor family protein [Acidobacteriota bacterium]
MSCKEYENQFSDRYDRLLPDPVRKRFDAHLETCSDCASQWELFKESLSSLGLLAGEKAPAGFKQDVYKRIAAGTARPGLASWRLLLSPAGASFCAVLLLVGVAAGYFIGHQPSNFPSEDIKAMLDKDGVALIPGRSGEDVSYALVPVRNRLPARQGPQQAQQPSAPPEFFIGGSETMEYYIIPGQSPGRERTPPPPNRTPQSQDQILRTLLDQSH